MVKTFGQLFSESITEFGNKFILFLNPFLYLFFLPALVFGFVLIFLMLFTFPNLAEGVITEVGSGVIFPYEFISSIPPGATIVFVVGIVFFVAFIILNFCLSASC